MNKALKYGIEILVILAVVLAAIYGITKINTSLTRNNQKEVLVTFEAQSQKEELLSKIQVGDTVSDNTKTTELGKVVALSENRPFMRAAKDYENEAFIQTPVDGYFDKDITVALKADVTDTAIMVGETELKIGYMVPLINEKYMVNCTVTRIEIQETKPEE